MPPELGDQLETFRREHQTTLLAPLLSAYALALRKWSGESDLVIGTPIGNRMHPETAHLIGPAANALALRVTWDPALSGAAFVSRTRMSVNAALAHQEYPFARLIHDLGATGAPHPPVFQVRFALQQPGETAPRVPGLDVTPLKIDRGVTKFDLSLIVAVQGARLRGWCEYNTALFKAETIARFADSFVRLAGRLVREPGRRLPDLLCS